MADGMSQDSLPLPESGIQILVVEDEGLFAKAMCKRFRRADYRCDIAASLAKAQNRIATATPDLIILDMRLPDGSGLTFLEQMREGDTPDIPVIVLTAHGELEDAVAAMKLKAIDYLKKPIDLDELLLTVEKAIQKVELARRLDYSRQRENRSIKGVQLLGESPAIELVRDQIRRIAHLTGQSDGSPPTVLILGETGSGKDLAARLLHLQSARSRSPFVQVDCAALPMDLIEAELFGHEKGAFTNAHARRTGLIEAAEDGTVFLDEIAEVPLELQSKLLAMLERRMVRRVGSSRELPVAAWFIAGTNRPLDAMVKENRFRADLYYRLKALTLHLPSLRERGDDVILLARHFAQHTARHFGLPAPSFDPQAINALLAYQWPGNVRELHHLVERAVLLSGGGQLSRAALMLEEHTGADQVRELQIPQGKTLTATESDMIREALKRTRGNVSQAARELGITRMTLRYRMQKYGIKASDK
jgi:DNA-binding NtrC family response regulator